MDVLALVTATAYIVFWAIVLSLVARRFLGLRAGPWRLVVSGAAGVAVAGLTVGGQVTQSDRNLGFMVLFVGVGLLTATAAIVVIEVVQPRLTLVSTLRAYGRWRRRAARYAQVSRIAVRHGLGLYLSGRRDPTGRHRDDLAARLRMALDEAGGAFVKLGQVLSTRRDLLPPAYIDELSRLQNDVAPVPWADVARLLADELDTPLDDVFDHVDPDPVAAASIAQVHRATLRTGEQVVVKVQRPDVRSVVDRDLDITLRIADALDRRTSWARTIGIRGLAEGFAGAMHEELDFTIEAQNLARVTAAHDRDDVVLPRLHPELSSRRVLVMEYLDGVPLDRAMPRVERLGLDRDELARALLQTLLTQMMTHGVFLADPIRGTSCCCGTDVSR